MAFANRRHASSEESSLDSYPAEENDNIPNHDFSEPYVYHDDHRDTVCLRGFRDLFESEELFDITLCVDDKEFQCHKALLASSSDYFRAMFTTNLAERDQTRVMINGVDASSMELVVKYLYTGQAQLNADTVQNLLSAANLFQLRRLRDGCAVYMTKKLDVENCLGIYFFAQAHECQDLKDDARDVIMESFDEVAENAEFLELSVENLLEVLKFDELQTAEENVYESVMKWIQHVPNQRSGHIYDLFSDVRFALIDEYYLYDHVISNTLVQSDVRLRELLDSIMRLKLLRSRWMEYDLRLEPRAGSDISRY